MEALKVKRKAERSQLTQLIDDIESTLSQDCVTEEQLCIISERLNHLHTNLRATDSDIVPLLSTTHAEAEFDRVVDYNDRATATSAKLKYRIRHIHESLNRTSPSTSNELVQRRQQPGVPSSEDRTYKVRWSTINVAAFWNSFNQVIHNNGGLTNVDKFTYLRSVLTGDAALAIAGFPANASCYSDALDILILIYRDALD
ncbi:hypothetical protein HPB49_003952 [Dermacentor silvarum]|uniref:Uncharacterized protein n=1 Tax=Dermacentor silvarum TaxID=543639 RepID=A0ACB8DTW9_DERSI|nr:uncharacterized protein LOC125943245 [Dermacentor silvarum]KAH7977925.1 hypothetical protein HPB49_003952 [Dermacentor silvarum]